MPSPEPTDEVLAWTLASCYAHEAGHVAVAACLIAVAVFKLVLILRGRFDAK